MSTLPDAAPDQPLAQRWTWGRVAIVVAVLVMVGFWAWIFSGAPKRANPDRLSDRAFVTRTEQRCRKLDRDLTRLPNAEDTTTPVARAEVLDRANDRVARFVDAIAADARRSGRDVRSVDGWIKDWRTYVNDRRDFADRLRKNPDARFYVSKSKLGDTVDGTIKVFADVNDMSACATPGDVG